MNSFVDIVEEIKSIVSQEFAPKKVFDKDIAAILGISPMNFATMKKRNKVPFTELLDFCAQRSISINWLLYGQSPESLIDATNKYYMVKYFSDVHVSAGGGSENDTQTAELMELPKHFVAMLGGQQALRHIEALHVTGDSMEPTLSYDDLVFIDRTKTDINRSGIFIIRTEAGLFIKRLQKRIDGTIDVISDNSVYPVQTLQPYELEILGRVVGRFGDVD